jgi:hypothetical protein
MRTVEARSVRVHRLRMHGEGCVCRRHGSWVCLSVDCGAAKSYTCVRYTRIDEHLVVVVVVVFFLSE